MTLQAAQNLCRLLMSTTGSFVRLISHWSYPSEEPWIMAIAIAGWRDGEIRQLPLDELLSRGFRREDRDGQPYYLINRVDDDGTPFVSRL